LLAAADLSDCVSLLTQDGSQTLVDAVFGSLDGSATLAKDTRKCLKAASKSVNKLSSTIYRGVIKCRTAILKGKVTGDPARCRYEDAKLGKRISKAKSKLITQVDKQCSSPAVLAAIDVCGAGPGGFESGGEVAGCLIAITDELTDTVTLPAARLYSPVSLVDAAYPPAPTCGDDIVNQGPSAFLPYGEECDGADSAACPGLCLPPGDLFECTCASSPRLRFLGDGSAVDLDIGWAGSFHDIRIAEGAGFAADIGNCDCTMMDGAACIGGSTDPVCSLVARTMPTCSWDPLGNTRCDAYGNGNFTDEDADCYVCDSWSDNAGAHCSNEGDCLSRCYDDAGTAFGPCSLQAECPAATVCRGRCDSTQTCIEMPNGAPTPSSGNGLGGCTVSVYRQNVTGTTNIITGEHAIDMPQYSRVHTGVTSSTPCPVCGGFCEGGPNDRESCRGKCSGSPASCRFDSDCPLGQTCLEVSADCPDGRCNLRLVCSSGTNAGAPCRLEADTGTFGTVSNDCPPNPSQNIAGNGLVVNWSPRTSEWIDEPGSMACTANGFELFDCPCPAAGGAATKPNACAPACDAGPAFGSGCADGSSAAGAFTSCSAGVNAGRACDEDGDCPGGACDANPLHCTGDPAFEHFSCTTNADCGGGVCGDACPGGRCVPLCVPDPSDIEDGICAAGPPTFHCSGLSDSFRVCGETELNGTCDAVCSQSAAACDSDYDCAVGEKCQGECTAARLCEAGVDGILGTSDDIPGAGVCVSDTRECPIYGIEGGDIYNGHGGPVAVKSVAAFCLSATGNGGINQVTGIGGPGRLRQYGVNVTNGFAILP
jgi:hypothetical protein